MGDAGWFIGGNDGWSGQSSGGGVNWGGVINSGLGTLNTVLQYKLLNNQINKGQTPTIVTDPYGRPSGVGVTGAMNTAAQTQVGSGMSGWLLIGGGALLVVMMLSGRK
jgi:hypothetical protein